ncbi:Pentatricopeptide repeat-containing protein, chloroplastic [Heracleum sosnowskyi]|uniref:Pentatricopeptide repeat-containing protein, chloroplastic n=1 Tax=Heracleum sosnowskyi TaxID=360622 RepID=A0AAD8M3B0_9APIA|nr:Pentatricopeptide repeat-containing protein, chloroplastic [Heracleum sosnowskyi]
MNAFVIKHFEIKFSTLGCFKFFNSLAFVESSSAIHGSKYKKHVSFFNPLQLFNEWSKSRKYTYSDTKCLHAHLLKTYEMHKDPFFANSLVDFYFKCGSLGYAVKLFDEIPELNVVSWNIMVSGYNENLLYEDSWRVFCRMYSLGFVPNEFTYGGVISACCALQNYVRGKQIYGVVMKNGLFSNGYVRAGSIDLFAKSGCFEDALRVFYDVSCDYNVVCWNAIISGAVKNKENLVALDLFYQMCRGFLLPNSFTYSSILTACTALEELDLGRGVQGRVIKCGAGEDIFVSTAIIDMYAKCGDMDEAKKEFSCMPVRNVVSWTAMISGFVQKGNSISALQLFNEMRKSRVETNKYTITSVIAACANLAMITEAQQIHCLIFRIGLYTDSAINASLINMYSKIGAVGLAELVFQEAENKHGDAWAGMISACARHGNSESAITLFRRMFQEYLRPDKFSTSSVLSIVECVNLGRQIHCFSLKDGLLNDNSVGSSLSTMYSKCDRLDESYKVFEQIVQKDNVSWASMIAGYAEHGCAYEAIQLFRDMLSVEVKPDDKTLIAVLTALSALHSLKIGKEIHAYALRRDYGKHAVADGALVNMYSKCGALHLARNTFDMIPVKDQVACSSLVSGLAQNGSIEDSLKLFHYMLMIDLGIDSFTMSSLVGAAARLNILGVGLQLHTHIIKLGLESEVSVGSSLVMMYSKFGNINDCLEAFDYIQKPDVISWTAIITSYALHGRGDEALSLYDLMKESGIKPDSVTFVGVLSACSHSGLVGEGYFHLNSMTKDYGIKPGHRHYACMVDLLGRSGKLDEAKRFIDEMPIKPDALVWATLLSSCKLHGDVELGRLAAEKAIELEPSDAGAYISISNIFADIGQWDEVVKIRSEMKETGLKKELGWSYA